MGVGHLVSYEQAGGGEAGAQRGDLVVVERHQRAADVAVVEHAEQLECRPWRWWRRSWRRPSRRRSRGAAAVKISRASAWSPATNASTIARELVAGGVADDRDEAAAAVGQPAEVGDVVAGVDGVAQLREPDAAREVADGVLDRDDGVELDRRPRRSRARSGAGAARDVVEHDRDAGRLGDGRGSGGARRPGRACCSTASRAAARRRRSSRPAGRARRECAVELVPTPATTVARSPTASLTAARISPSSATRGGRRLPRRAGDHDAVVAVVDQVGRRSGRCRRGRPTRRRGTRWPSRSARGRTGRRAGRSWVQVIARDGVSATGARSVVPRRRTQRTRSKPSRGARARPRATPRAVERRVEGVALRARGAPR